MRNDSSNLKELIDQRKTKSKIERFARDTGLPVHYLTLLKREASSYLPNPVRIDKFPGIDPHYVQRLAAEGFMNARQLFNLAIEKENREQLALRLEIPLEKMNELVGLSDLVRA